MRSTFTPNVLADVGSFGGLFALTALPAQPALVASIDGAGTKVKLAAQLARWESIGHDLADPLRQRYPGAECPPPFFLDYIAAGKLVFLTPWRRRWQAWPRRARPWAAR